jgi:hypothetical protein
MAEQKASKAIAKTGVQGEALPTEHRAEIAKQHTEMAAALWPQKLTLAEKAAVAAVAEAYGLDPLMGELRILGGNLYVTKPGLNRMAYEDANPPVSIQVTPCSEQERTALGLTHDDP